jgi:hypothetical protein
MKITIDNIIDFMKNKQNLIITNKQVKEIKKHFIVINPNLEEPEKYFELDGDFVYLINFTDLTIASALKNEISVSEFKQVNSEF